MRSWLTAIFWIGLCELVEVAATPLTISTIPTWYAALIKPSFAPPNWLFGPVWTTLYFLMGLAAFLVWRKAGQKKAGKGALTFFLIQLGLNFFWSELFFGLRSPLLGLIGIILLEFFIAITILKFKKISVPAAFLLIPYLLWVSFALVLNLSIYLLNP